ncbi:MAG: penicillin-binding protein 1C, partial [Flavobacteriaceae bacterium]|nr:penicillin-binding protein 1C [Flavobacteriaceae bacterium]
AVRLLRKYGLPRFHNRLQEMNFRKINKPANYYGLSLILGGAESSLLEITNAYAGLASTLNFFNRSSSEYRSNEFDKPQFVLEQAFNHGEKQTNPEVIDAGAIYKTFEALREVNRPIGEQNWNYFSSSQPIAWKTGTSFGFKDAWAIGVTSKYAIGVWVGNADGEGRPGLTGVEAAAPILFEVLDILPKSDWFATPYDELMEAEICGKSGHLASLYCEEVATEFIPKNGMITQPCSYHQQVFLTQNEMERVNSSCYPLASMKQKNWFVLPPVQEYYYSNSHPEYRPLPPFKQDCLKDGEELMDFIFPKKNETILLANDFNSNSSEVIFKLAHRTPETKVYWYLDESFIGITSTFHELAYEPLPGQYTLTAVDQNGNETRQTIEISRASL